MKLNRTFIQVSAFHSSNFYYHEEFMLASTL